MSATLAPIAKGLSQGLIEKDHSFRCHCTVLSCAKAEDIDTSTPSQVSGRTAQTGYSIRETCPVDVYVKTVALCHLSKGTDLIRRIDSSRFSCLGEAYGRGLYIMHDASTCSR